MQPKATHGWSAHTHSVMQFFDIWTWKSAPRTTVFQHFHFQMCFSPQRRAIFRHQNFQKCSRNEVFFNIFTSECTFRHRCVHFFNIRSYKSGPNTSCFVHSHFRVCFSPQRRTFFRRLKSKKCFGADVFCTFSLENVLFTTAACNFWFIRWPPDSAPAALTGLLFDWPDTRIIEKHSISWLL